MEFKILNKKSEDIQQVREIYENSFVENEKENFDELLKNENFNFFVAYDNNSLVSFICFEQLGNFAFIMYFAVKQSFRNKGYGSKVIKTFCLSNNLKTITLNIHTPIKNHEDYETNLKRQNFYVKNGFSLANFLFDWRGDNYQPLFIGKLNKDDYMAYILKTFDDITNLKDK